MFSFINKELVTEEQFDEDDLIIKIYSNDQEYEPIIIQGNDRVIKIFANNFGIIFRMFSCIMSL